MFETLEEGLTKQFISVFVKKETLQGRPATYTDIFPFINPKPFIERF